MLHVLCCCFVQMQHRSVLTSLCFCIDFQTCWYFFLASLSVVSPIHLHLISSNWTPIVPKSFRERDAAIPSLKCSTLSTAAQPWIAVWLLPPGPLSNSPQTCETNCPIKTSVNILWWEFNFRGPSTYMPSVKSSSELRKLALISQ